jgi:hypothetical protein
MGSSSGVMVVSGGGVGMGGVFGVLGVFRVFGVFRVLGVLGGVGGMVSGREGTSFDLGKNTGNIRFTPDKSAFSSMTSPEPISSDDKAYPMTKAMGIRRRRINLA